MRSRTGQDQLEDLALQYLLAIRVEQAHLTKLKGGKQPLITLISSKCPNISLDSPLAYNEASTIRATCSSISSGTEMTCGESPAAFRTRYSSERA